MTFLSCAAVVILLAVATYAGVRACLRAVADTRWVAHTHEVIAGFETLRTLVLDAESSVRAYAIIGGDDFLAALAGAETGSVAALARLGERTADNPHQQQRIARLGQLLGGKHDANRQVVLARDQRGLDGAVAQVASRVGKERMDALRVEIDAGVAAERELLTRRQDESRRAARDVIIVMAVSFALQIALLGVGGTLLVREQRRRQAVQDDLRAAHGRYQGIIESTSDLIVAFAPDYRITGFNQAFARATLALYGRHAAEGLHLDDLLAGHDDDLAAARGFWARAFAGEELTVTRAFGDVQRSRRHLEVRYSPTRDAASGLVTGASCIVRDVTDRVRAEDALAAKGQELQRSNAELQQFAYVASHDLQEPLRMVASYTGLLARRYGERLDADAREFIAFAVDGARRMQTLIDDLLDYARVGHRGIAPRRISADQCLDQALAALGAALRESGATVERAPLPEVDADPLLLAQVFQNLVGNAIKYRGAQAPLVRIGARREGDRWIIHVADNGIGIAPEFHERIFGVFQRLHSRGEYSGTGIGLAIVRKIIERHGGAVRVESAAGQGSTFHVALPIVDASPVPGAAPAPHPDR